MKSYLIPQNLNLPQIIRVILDHDHREESTDPHEVLKATLAAWPSNYHCFAVSFPGGFLEIDNLDAPLPRHPLQPTWAEYCRIAEVAAVHMKKVFSAFRRQISGRASLITCGVDGWIGDEFQVQFVFTLDVKSGRTTVCGKSKPTKYERRNLIPNPRLESYFQTHSGESIMLLGCHDLNHFSGRARASMKSGPLKVASDQMLRLAKKHKPRIVLQHPHSTFSPNVWRVAWAGVQKHLSSPQTWCGTGNWCDGGRDRDPKDLVKVLTATASDDVATILVSLSPQDEDVDDAQILAPWKTESLGSATRSYRYIGTEGFHVSYEREDGVVARVSLMDLARSAELLRLHHPAPVRMQSLKCAAGESIAGALLVAIGRAEVVEDRPVKLRWKPDGH